MNTNDSSALHRAGWWQRVGRLGRPVLMGLGGAALLTGCSVTPEPLRDDAVHAVVEQDLQVLDAVTVDPVRSFDLADAIAHAIRNNRDYRVQLIESTLALAQTRLASLDMLPDLTAQAGYRHRNRPVESFSESEGEVSDQPSISQERSRTNADLAFEWSILDFGLSYVRAQQQADRLLIARERERKAVQNIVLEVRTAYWRAVSAERLLERIDPLMEQVAAALERARTVESSQADDPLVALNYQRQLLDILRSLEELQGELQGARTELATLMGLRPGTEFALADVEQQGFEIPTIGIDLGTMENAALTFRPELMESRYDERVSRKEVRAALLSMAPDLTLGLGASYDGNKFLNYNSWNQYSALASWNLFAAFRSGAAVDAAELSVEIARERQLALSMGVLSQLHLAAADFEQAKRRFGLATENLDVSGRILRESQARFDAGLADRKVVIQESLNALVAELRRDVAYADIQNAFGRMHFAMGLDPLDEGFGALSEAALTDAVTERLVEWEAVPESFLLAPMADAPVIAEGPGELMWPVSMDGFGLLGDALSAEVSLPDGSALPEWLRFDPDAARFVGNPPALVKALDVSVTVANAAGTRLSDSVTLVAREANDTPTLQRPVDRDGPVHLVESDTGIVSDPQRLVLIDDDPVEQIRWDVAVAGRLVDEAGAERPWPDALPGVERLRAMLAIDLGDAAVMEQLAMVGWFFDSDGEAFDPIRSGEHLDLRYTVTATDPEGASAEQALDIRISGEADAPVLQSQAEPIVLHTRSGGELNATGPRVAIQQLEPMPDLNVKVLDVEASLQVEGRMQQIPEGVIPDEASLLAALSTDLDPVGALDWSVRFDAADFDGLPENSTLSLRYSGVVANGDGPAAPVELTVQLFGHNQAPQVAVGDSPEPLQLGAGRVRQLGRMTLADSDLDEQLSVSVRPEVYLLDSDGERLPLPPGAPSRELFARMMNLLPAIAPQAMSASLRPVSRGETVPALVDLPTGPGQTVAVDWAFEGVPVHFDWIGPGETGLIVYSLEVTDSQGARTAAVIPVALRGDR